MPKLSAGRGARIKTDTKRKNFKKGPRVVLVDFKKILDFLKSKPSPQKTLAIARGCQLQTSGEVNPTLYAMQRKGLVQKVQEVPPLWAPADASLSSASFPSPNQLERVNEEPATFSNMMPGKNHYNRTYPNREERYPQNRPERNHHNYQENNQHQRGRTSFGKNFVSRGMSPSLNTAAGRSSLDPTTDHNNLFKPSISDANAPGAYKVEMQLEHSHIMRLTQYDSSRRHSPAYSESVDRSQHAHKSKHPENQISRPHTQPVNDPAPVGRQAHEPQPPETHAPEQAAPEADSVSPDIKPSLEASDHSHLSGGPSLGGDAGAQTMEVDHDSSKDSDFTDDDDDDDDEDINWRISDVVSIRDPDFKFHSFASSSQDGSGCESSSEPAASSGHPSPEKFCKEELESSESVGHSASESDLQESGLKLLVFLNNIPMKSTTRDTMLSELCLQPSDLDKLLNQFIKDGLIQTNSANFFKLTNVGETHVLELCQPNNTLKSRGAPPLLPDPLLQQKNLYNHLNTLAIGCPRADPVSTEVATRSGAVSSHNSTTAGHSLGKLDTNIMPWLKPLSQVSTAQQMPGGIIYSSCPSTSTSTFPPLSSRPGADGGLNQPGVPKQAPHSLESFRPVSSAEDRLQSLPPGKRPPLLNTPGVRGSGRQALLPTQESSHGRMIMERSHQQTEDLQISMESFAALNKNPISAFMEYGQSRHLPAKIEVLNQRGPPHKPVFTIAALLGNRVFPGISSSNKKDGKKEAAEQAVRMLIAEGQYNMPVTSVVTSLPESSMTHFDKMAALTHNKFNKLIAQLPESLVGRKVIAGLVMKMNGSDTGTVVAIGSGNRCITGDKLSLKGLTVNDCHAEIITRRGFIRFLYNQLASYTDRQPHPLFENSASGKLKIKDQVTFHLYISTAPCGDGALFSPRDVESNNVALTDSCVTHRPTFETSVQGVLRTKMEGGEGTIPVDPEKPMQTWDGIARGERLRTMSCSDKICRWNVLGLQGALLANILDPIYLASITLGFLFDAGHLSRAVCCRLDRGEPALDTLLPQPYHLNHPALGRVTACEPTRETQKTKSYSVNWMLDDEKPEIVDGCQGTCYTWDKSEPLQCSRLCKKSMFDSFQRTCRQLAIPHFLQAKTYAEAKRMSQGFCLAKERMKQRFKDTNCGIWLDKPVEEDMFS